MLDPPKELPHLNPPQPPNKNTHTPTAHTENPSMVIRTENPKIEPKKNLTLPIIEIPQSQEIIISPPRNPRHTKDEESPNFDEAIRNIHLDMIGSDERKEVPAKQDKKEEYYPPKNLGEGYFSEIKHYLKNRDAKEIVDDILKKDFLTGMKDYHDQKGAGKPYYLHGQDLKEKLEARMEELMQKEESWHTLKKVVEDNERKKKHLEQEIDQEAQDLKELFRLVKMNHILEVEAKPGQEFTLRSGQKLKCLNDLRKVLNYMHEDEFHHHVNHERNDFATWAKHALSLDEVSEKIKVAKTKEELLSALKKDII